MALGALVLLSGCCGTGCKKSECPAQPADDSLMVVLDLHRKVKPESVAAFKASFARCKAATGKEQGCIDYGVYQSPDDSTEFLIYEVWQNQAVLSAHWNTEHLKKHAEEVKPMVVSKWDRHIHVCPGKMEETK